MTARRVVVALFALAVLLALYAAWLLAARSMGLTFE